MDDSADNDWQAGSPVQSLENASGNYLALDIGGGRFAFYEHLQHRSLTVEPGARVRRGQVVARLGYSGSSSIGPHLHFHVSDAKSPLSAEGLPFVFRGSSTLVALQSIDAMIGGATVEGGAGTTRNLARAPTR
jgi:murein DD-endopeptidase MepM/ murein hydrolase activator NlpD